MGRKGSKRRLAACLCALFAVLAFALCGCSGDAGGEAEAETQRAKAGTGYQTAADMSGSGGDIDGSGRVHYGRMPDSDELLVIKVGHGTTAFGKVPSVKVDGPDDAVKLTVVLSGFSTSRVIYVKVDGKLVGVYSTHDAQAKLTLTGPQIESGTHSVEASQHAGDDPTAATTLYKCCQYAIEG